MSEEYIDDEDTPLPEAVKYMTDEWIAGGNYSEFTVQRLRDGYKAAEHRMHQTAFGVGMLCLFVGYVAGWLIFAFKFGGW